MAPATEQDYYIELILSEQRLFLKKAGWVEKTYRVSTAANGAGEKQNSACTPRGKHSIAEKTGAGCAVNTVFVGRKPTGEYYTPALARQFPERDWILTRILRLSGEEPGFNKGGEVDSYARFIYIHGAPDEVEMGIPGSHGCIRMHNQDVIHLFDRVKTEAELVIRES